MIPFADLKRQYQNLKQEIDACIHDSLETTSFIGGAQVSNLKNRFQNTLDQNIVLHAQMEQIH